MARSLPVALVVPAFQEEARLRLEAFQAAVRGRPWLHLCFVDDGSEDATPRLLGELVASLPAGRARLLRLHRNQGKGEAVRQGLRALLAEGGQAALGYWDADLSAPLEQVDAFVEALDQGADLVLGSRFRHLGARIERRLVRHLGGRVVATAISNLLGLPVYDTQCGAKLLRVDGTTAGLLSRPFQSRWLFDVELIARWMAAHPGGEERIRELPLAEWTHRAGSKLRPADALAVPWELLRIARAEGLPRR